MYSDARMDPHQVLMVAPGQFTVAQLKNNYRTLAGRLHPSVCSLPPKEADVVMRRLTLCYKRLMDETAPQRHAARKGAENDGRGVAAPPPPPPDNKRMTELAKNMDMERFNRVFEETRVRDAHNAGYQSWLTRADLPPEDVERVCDSQTLAEPDPVSFMSSRDLGFSDIGVTSVDNFGNPVTRYNAMQFTDLRDAHSERHNLMNSRMVRNFTEKPVRSVDDFKAERSDAKSVQLTPEERAMHERLRLLEQQKDAERRAAVREQDKLMSRQFDRSRALLLNKAAGASAGA